MIQKDTNKMIQKAKETTEKKDKKEVKDEKKITYAYKDSFANKTKSVRAKIDVKCEEPDKEYPIIRVTPREFTQKEVDNVINELIGDSKFLKLDYEPSKKQIEDEIISLKKDYQDGDPSDLLASDRDTVGEVIKILKRQLATAPDKVEEEEASRKLVDYKSGSRIRGYTKEANGRMKYLDIENGCIPGSVDLTYTYMPQKDSQGYDNDHNCQAFKESQLRKLKMTQEEAVQKAEDLLKKLHMNNHNEFGVYEVRKAYDETMLLKEHRKNDIPFAYMIIFTRNFNGMISGYGDQYFNIYNDLAKPVANYLNDTAKEDSNSAKDDGYAMEWNRETVCVYLDDSGVTGFRWTEPCKVDGTVVKNSKLLSFEKIKGIIKKMILMKFQPEPSRDSLTVDYITGKTIKLELERIPEKGKKLQGLYVPAWNIYGDDDCIAKKKSKDFGDLNMKNEKLISINAIDGSIIELPRDAGGIG
ncbi:hypothetical protein lbkm_2697 [Lachnospiraceae bacterium KM106-2]|nr:hypothetical protein lbkm_2697 [Lachnospiraceae bacterium KM106-2]